MSARELFAKMSVRELEDVIGAILAARRLFDTEGASASNADAFEHMQSWADRYVDRLQEELESACAEYLGREITDHDERRSRELALASAYNWLR